MVCLCAPAATQWTLYLCPVCLRFGLGIGWCMDCWVLSLAQHVDTILSLNWEIKAVRLNVILNWIEMSLWFSGCLKEVHLCLLCTLLFFFIYVSANCSLSSTFYLSLVVSDTISCCCFLSYCVFSLAAIDVSNRLFAGYYPEGELPEYWMSRLKCQGVRKTDNHVMVLVWSVCLRLTSKIIDGVNVWHLV